MGLLEKRLDGETLTILNRQETEGAKYAELLDLGGIEAIRDSILPETFNERSNKVEMHVQRACSVCDPGVRFPGLRMRTVDLALVLTPITPLLSHQTALNMCGMLPMDYDILESLFFCLPEEPSILWQVDTFDGARDFKLEICPDCSSADSKRSPIGDDSVVWLKEMTNLHKIRLARVIECSD